jgi:hypothetical protein
MGEVWRPCFLRRVQSIGCFPWHSPVPSNCPARFHRGAQSAGVVEHAVLRSIVAHAEVGLIRASGKESTKSRGSVLEVVAKSGGPAEDYAIRNQPPAA